MSLPNTPASRRTTSSLAAAGLLLACALAAGCGRLGRQFEWVDTHPQAPAGVKRAVLGKKLVMGMTQDAVLASWNEPVERLALGGGDSRWVYRRLQLINNRRSFIEYTLIFNRGTLIKVLKQRRR